MIDRAHKLSVARQAKLPLAQAGGHPPQPGLLGWTAPNGIAMCQNEFVESSIEGDRPWNRLFDTRAGDEMLRSILVVGATALLQYVRAGRSRHTSQWLIELLQRKKPKLVAVALANKIARIAWKLMVSGERYRRAEGQTQAVIGHLGEHDMNATVLS
jgi:hypothetical protein